LRVSERTGTSGRNNAGLTFSGLLNDLQDAVARRMLSEQRFDHIGSAGIGLRVGLSESVPFIRQCAGISAMTPAASATALTPGVNRR